MRRREAGAIPLIAWALVLSTFAMSPRSEAQAVYRCVEKGKPVSFQNTPCSAKAKITAIRDYVPERAPTPNELAWKRHRIEQEMAARNRQARSTPAAATGAVLPVGTDACTRAKAERDAWERRVGLHRTVEGLRFWQDHVYRACR